LNVDGEVGGRVLNREVFYNFLRRSGRSFIYLWTENLKLLLGAAGVAADEKGKDQIK
jgi:hypothetical protein